MAEYVLVSQGVEIYRTKCKEEALAILRKGNEDWQKYVEKCIENWEIPADNEIFLYEE